MNKKIVRYLNEKAKKYRKNKKIKPKMDEVEKLYLSLRNKGQSTFLIISVIFFILLISGCLIAVFLIGSPSKNGLGINNNSTMIKVYFTALDSISKSIVPVNYIIYENNTMISSGQTLSDSPLELNVRNYSIDIYCWSNEYYTTKIHKDFDYRDIELGSTKMDCIVDRIGKPEIKIIGDLKNTRNQILVNITSKSGIIKRPGICMAWTIGIISIDDKNYIPCPSRWTELNKTYYCNGEKEICNDYSCLSSNMDIPMRFKNKVDKCTYFGGQINKDESRAINLVVDTYEFKNSFDNIELTLFDQDKRDYSNWEYTFENLNKSNIGMEDASVKIEYE